MTPTAQTFLESFDALSEDERMEVAAEILRRVTCAQGELPEQALVDVADQVFCLLDAEEENSTDASR
jgi:hypothetical protein